MAEESGRSRARRRLLYAAPIIVVLLAAWWLFPRDSSQPTPVAPEAYSYATTGFEGVDILLGARHDYPETTGITVRDSDCGHWLEWQPLKERKNAYEICDGELRAIHEVHEFFGTRDERTYDCTPGSSLERGWECTYENTTEVARGGVVGRERLGGVETIHVRLETTISGDTEGTGTRDFWLRRSDGFPIRIEETNDNTTGSPVGKVNYTERYTLELSEPPPASGAIPGLR